MNITRTYLTEAYAIDNASILRILTQNKQINKADPKYKYYEKLANWANTGGKQQKLKNIDLSTIKISDRGLIKTNKLANNLTTLGHALLALKNLMDQNGKYDPSNELSKLIQQTTLEILAGLSGIKDDTKPAEEPDETEKPEEVEDPEEDDTPEDTEEAKPTTQGSVKDWTAYHAEKLAKAKANGQTTSEALDEFYNEYYKLEYAGLKSAKEEDTTGIVAKLKSLDKILIPEFTKLGYNPQANPFAQFLKLLIKHKNKEIFQKLSTNNYGAIHNSFIRGYIKGNQLGNYYDKNILFCSDLYNYKGLDIVNYLSSYGQTITAAKSNSAYSNDPELLAAKIFIQQTARDEDFEANIKKLLDDTTNINLPGNSNTKLRSELEVSELYNHIFNKKLKKQVNVNSIVSQAKAGNLVLDMLRLLLDQNAFVNAYPDDIDDYEEWLQTEMKYVRDGQKIKDSRNLLAKYALKLADMEKLFKELRKAAIAETKAGT